MKKLFRMPIYLGIILILAGLIGCSNPLDLQEKISAPPAGERTLANGGGVGVPIPIASAAQMALIGNDPAYPLNGDYVLTASITLANWVPTGADANAPFTGSFDGDGFSISLTSFDATALVTKSYLGIFGYIAGTSSSSKAELKDINVISSISGISQAQDGQAVGLLAGYTGNTEISGINLTGSFSYSSTKVVYVGGIVGYAQEGTVIEDSTAAVTMNINGGTNGALVPGIYYNYVGGIVGMFMGGVEIHDCANTAGISGICTTSGSQVFCGGIAGGSYYQFTTDSQGTIVSCYSTGTITARCPGYWSWAGGIAGCIVGDGTKIEKCYATGTVTVENSPADFPYVGGIVGYNYYGGMVSECWFYGNVLSNTDGNYTGGIAGYNSQTDGHNSTIENCWSGGTVQGLHNAGGIVGQNQINTYVRNCYSIAQVVCLDTCDKNKSSTNPGVGGIAGFNASALADSITGCVALNIGISAGSGRNIHRVVGYNAADTQTNNLAWENMPVTTSAGDYFPDKGLDRPGGADVELQPEDATYMKLGWDFTPGTGVWEMGSEGYPQLQWQTFYPPIPPPLPSGI
jgi:hypothetical protein